MAHETKGTEVTDGIILHFIIMILNIEYLIQIKLTIKLQKCVIFLIRYEICLIYRCFEWIKHFQNSRQHNFYILIFFCWFSFVAVIFLNKEIANYFVYFNWFLFADTSSQLDKIAYMIFMGFLLDNDSILNHLQNVHWTSKCFFSADANHFEE